MNILSVARRYFPILTWGAEYSSRTLVNDLTVAVIVTVMLIPQSLAYALLAGLPVQVGLFASMAPLFVAKGVDQNAIVMVSLGIPMMVGFSLVPARVFAKRAGGSPGDGGSKP